MGYHKESTCYLLSRNHINRLGQDTAQLVPVCCRCTRGGGKPPLHGAVDEISLYDQCQRQHTDNLILNPNLDFFLKHKHIQQNTVLLRVTRCGKGTSLRYIYKCNYTQLQAITSHWIIHQTNKPTHGLWCQQKQQTSMECQFHTNLPPVKTNYEYIKLTIPRSLYDKYQSLCTVIYSEVLT